MTQRVESIAAALVAALVDYVTNFGIVVFATSLMYRTSDLRLARTATEVSEFLVSFTRGSRFLVWCSPELFSVPNVQFLAVLTVIAPLLFARQMFLRSHALEEAHIEADRA
jgi:hypothetical protein